MSQFYVELHGGLDGGRWSITNLTSEVKREFVKAGMSYVGHRNWTYFVGGYL